MELPQLKAESLGEVRRPQVARRGIIPVVPAARTPHGSSLSLPDRSFSTTALFTYTFFTLIGDILVDIIEEQLKEKNLELIERSQINTKYPS